MLFDILLSKFHLMFLELRNSRNVAEEAVDAFENVKLQGATIESKIKFCKHFKSLCVKIYKKLVSLSRVAEFLNDRQFQMIHNSFTNITNSAGRIEQWLSINPLINQELICEAYHNLILKTFGGYHHIPIDQMSLLKYPNIYRH